jgi:hypothetical protein
MARESIAPRRSLRAENISLSIFGTNFGTNFGTSFGISEIFRTFVLFTNMIHKGFGYFHSSYGCSLIGHGDQNHQFGHTLCPHQQAVMSLSRAGQVHEIHSPLSGRLFRKDMGLNESSHMALRLHEGTSIMETYMFIPLILFLSDDTGAGWRLGWSNS